MLTNLFLILAYFACLHAVKNDRRFESTGAMIFATCWLAIENGFENVSEVVFEGTKAAGRDVVGDPGVVGGGVRFVLPAGMETDMRAVQGDGSADEGGDDGDAGGRRGSTGTTLVTGGVKASASVTSPSPSFSDRFELADMPHRRMSGVNHNQTNTKNGTTPTYAPPRRPSTSPLTTMSGPEQSPKVPASSRRSRRPGAGLDGVDGRGDDGESGL
ncbi:uncharacterized protein EV422DRAFT_540834 [Fimicolochytrium jonesii]|uniref:uncharacterized protein n=1 Tax=Fimicolochytrium jonesii TaxID=1396493 RepID=UPI0022FDE495|nr:uncharacterized protein EV422DRAFT_540834 [Fimicolochytrium jonesii]KAI8817755.1 hypothetical protein EV422DRAFT_540834 [Fimicolochytrium jonesii]